MGWLSSIFGSEKSSDPLSKLDPKLREFLEKESPVKYEPSTRTQSSAASRDDAQKIVQAEATKPAVPSESLYQDGRYAYLWKNYRSLSQVEAETATEQEKLTNVIEGFKGRKAALGRAALENCALQQEEWVNCMKSGAWEDRLQMCRHQVRRFERCYSMQSRFLRALGYGSIIGRSPQVDEDIQMHADSLFQRMINHEKAVEQAKKDGTPIPVFEIVLPKTQVSKAAKPTEEVQKEWKEQLDQLPDDERPIEEAALRADLQAKTDVADSIKDILQTQKKEREARIAEGKPTFSDRIAALVGRGGK
ncbi:hypothetical protein CDD83_7835 [Cordyceps sp. RAO-2017]|nr:hypothetical protein CDD83_7835 [Cordyceps sp. RAO-2017]